jgi:hypothetical protein
MYRKSNSLAKQLFLLYQIIENFKKKLLQHFFKYFEKKSDFFLPILIKLKQLVALRKKYWGN